MIKTIRFTKESFYFTILSFSESHTGVLGDIPGFVQLITGSYKSNKPINIIVIDKMHQKWHCFEVSILDGVRLPILYSLTLNSPPGHKIFKEPRIKLFKNINKPAMSHITFYLEDEDHKPVVFNGERISFTCQLIKIQ